MVVDITLFHVERGRSENGSYTCTNAENIFKYMSSPLDWD